MRIFIVDDNQIFRDIAYTLVHDLHNEPLDIVRFENAHLAWKAFETDPADVVVTDVNMPFMSGIALLERIRERSSETSVIVMSFQPLYEEEALKKGADAFFEKPFDEKAFSDTMERIIKKHLP